MLSNRSRRLIRPNLRKLEDRVTPAIFNINNGDVAGLVAAIKTINTNNEPDIVNLAAGGKYTFTAAADTNKGGLGLPEIVVDNNETNTLTINGNGSTWIRQSAAQFRFILAVGDSTALGITISELTFDNGNANGSGGAAFFDDVDITFNNCVFQNNTGISNSGVSAGAVVSTGQNNRSMTFNDCIIRNNTGLGGFGGGIGNINTSKLTLNSTQIINNTALGTGGLINSTPGLTVTMANCIVSNNVATAINGGEGGILMDDGDLIFTDGEISGNTAALGGGVTGNKALTFINSSIHNNKGTDPLSLGGGIIAAGDLTLSNSTVDSNEAGNAGGIVFATAGTTGTITNSTITSNNAFAGPGGGIFVIAGSLSIGNSILALNTSAGGGDDIAGTLNSLDFNLIGVTNGGTFTGQTANNLTGNTANPLDPMLLPLGDNGGPTKSRAPRAGSPILDAGDPNFVGPPDTDQRGTGFPRMIDRLDIGAIEARPINLLIVKDDGQTSAIPGQGIIYIITVSNLGPVAAIGAQLIDVIPPELQNAQWQGMLPGGGVVNGVGDIDTFFDLAVGEFATFTLSATIDPNAQGTLNNSAMIVPPVGFTNAQNNTATDSDVLTRLADVGVVKFSTGGPATPGNPISYTIIVSNDGPSSATGINLTDFFPSSITGTSWQSSATGGATGNTKFGFGNINDLLNLPPQSTITYTITANVSPDATTGNLVNVASITLPFDINDPNPDNNIATDVTKLIVGKQVIVTAPDRGQVPIIRVFNPGSGNLRASFLAYSPAFRGGVRVAVADFNGDGVQDIVTAPGPGGGPHIKIFNGNDFSLMSQYFAYAAGFVGGVYIATGDVNGDQIPDVICGPGAGGGPHVRVFSGITSTIIPEAIGEFFAYDSRFTGGVRVAAGDTNGDGRADVVTGAGPGGGPHVIVWDSANRTPRLSFFAYDPGFRGGVFVAAGDFNFDSTADVVTSPSEGGSAHIKFFDGRNQLPFREFFAFPANTGGPGSNAFWSSGARIAVLSDIDGDGLNEIVVSPGAGRAGVNVNGQMEQVRIFGGALLNQLRALPPQDPAFLGGIFVGAA